MSCSGHSVELPKVYDGNETLDNGVLRIGGTSFPPYAQWTDLGDTVRVDGPLVIFIEVIARFLRARPVVATPIGLPYGALQKNATFNGVLGYLERKKVDIMVNPVIPSVDRHGRFDFSAPFTREKFRFFTIKPATFIHPWGFVRAFELPVWFFILGTFLVLPVCSAFLRKLDRNLSRLNSEGNTRGVFGYLWFWFARIFPQPDLTPRVLWLRVSAALFMLPMTYMVMRSLEAELKRSLLFKKEADYANYFPDILRFHQMRIISEKNSMGTAMFTRSQDPLMMKLAKRLDERAGVLAGDNFESLIKNILEKKAVVVTTGLAVKLRISILAQQTGRCPGVRSSDGSIFPVTLTIPIGLHIQKHVRDRIQSAVLRVAESATFHQKLHCQLEYAKRCGTRHRGEAEPMKALHISDLKGVLYLFAIGIATSMLAFAAELPFPRIRRFFSTSSNENRV
ncbi:glutamate receptor U1-like [Varroa jacobsoni]|uniref:Uncharacterized protein n=1 Tax=Varroa destructor TaxID=109461 RepID=A0A7M7IYT4_VARDE|nr:glutamate receptor U1-like [Varroa destructor]XP_022693030.1 glutamate receptor U1-like [Varroa jacobsoni]XP_022693031.1 glutamate receptor U1-like [Varroa jacobsoni]